MSPRPRDTENLEGSLVFDLLSPVFVFLTPFTVFVRYHGYELTRPEIILAVVIISAIGVLIGALIRLKPASLRPALFAILVLLFTDLQFRMLSSGLWVSLSELLPSQLGGLIIIGPVVLYACTLFFLTWLLRRHLGTIFMAVFAMTLAASLLGPAEARSAGQFKAASPTAPRSGLPPVIHLVLDEHIGVAGIPGNIPGGLQLKEDIVNFYRDYGFSLYAGAYSEYAETHDSLSSLVNGEKISAMGENLNANEHGNSIAKNAWFKSLLKAGYKVRVYQEDELDFCASEDIDACYTYPTNSILTLSGVNLPAHRKARIILGHFLSGSITYNVASMIVHKLSPHFANTPLERVFSGQFEERYLGSVGSYGVFERITKDILAAPEGTAFFAHLLIPHYSYAFDEDCRMHSDILSWLNNKHGLHGNTPASRQRRYELYFRQIRCVEKQLAALFEAMRKAGTFDAATIILHGDHGSRIALEEPRIHNIKRISDADIIDTYSTLFALKTPGGEAKHIHQPRSLHNLFRELLLKRPLVEDDGGIFISAPFWKKGTPFLRIPMPPLQGEGAS